MTDEAIEVLKKEIDKRSADFQDVWKRTPSINRMIFNKKMEEIRESCQKLYLINRFKAEAEKSEMDLKKSIKMFYIYIFLFCLLSFFLSEFGYFETEFYKGMAMFGPTIPFNILIIIFVAASSVGVALPWLDYNIKINNLINLEINSRTDITHHSPFYKWIMIDVDNIL